MKSYEVTISVPPTIRCIPFYRPKTVITPVLLPGVVMARKLDSYDKIIASMLTMEVVEERDGVYTHAVRGNVLTSSLSNQTACGVSPWSSYLYIPMMSTVHILNSIMWRQQNQYEGRDSKVARSVGVKLSEKSLYTYVGLHVELRQRGLFEPSITFLADLGKLLRTVEENRQKATEEMEKTEIWFYPNTIARVIVNDEDLRYISNSDLILSIKEV